MQLLPETGLLLVLGASLVIAFIGALVMKRVGIPQLLGFMLAGLLLGAFTPFRSIFDDLYPIVDLALGLIGYNIGLEIRKDVFSGRTRQMGTILILESILTFGIVTLLTFIIIGQLHIAIVFGALASATDPASTIMVIWENRCKGNLTDTLMFVLALDDVIAILLANVAITVAVMFYMGTIAISTLLVSILSEIVLAAVVGLLFGAAMVYFINREANRALLLEFELGMIILLVGLMVILHGSAILACMVFGFIVGNYVQPEKDPISHTLKTVMSPIVMIFFVIVGASIDFATIFATIGVIVIIITLAYVGGRSVAKYVGAYVGATISHTDEVTKRYLGYCLMSQAGVAVGLALVVENRLIATGLPDAIAAGTLILSVIVLTTLILQMFGPIAAAIGLKRSGEVPLIFRDCIPLKQDIDPLAGWGSSKITPKSFDAENGDLEEDEL